MSVCNQCPRACGIDRAKAVGFCNSPEGFSVARVGLHPWEEPVLCGKNGAGTIFFAGCNLRCVFCQNHDISAGGFGKPVTVVRLRQIFRELVAQGAHNVNLVTPTHYVPQIIHALAMAKERGFVLPVVYNSGAYEREETIEALKGYVDIYLPDLKYLSGESAGAYSAAPDYPEAAQAAIRAMFRQVGPLRFHEDGSLESGVIVRHMVLPGHRHESMAILDWLWQEFGHEVQISLMSQYTPMYRAGEFKHLNRRLTTFEYESVVEHARELGITRCYTQERRAASEEYVPDFDGRGVRRQP